MNNNKSGGIGVAGLLLVAFVILKLCNVIDWNWWWVLSPFWIPLSIVVLILIGFGIYYVFSKKKVKNHTEIGRAIKNESTFQRRLREAQERQKI